MKIYKAVIIASISFLLMSFSVMSEEKTITEQEKMMAEWMKLASPGEKHKHFEVFVGEWDSTITMWQTPDAEALTNTGTASSKLILGGRYLLTEYTGSFMGTPFEGFGLYGYDNLHKIFNSLWIDNFGTGFYLLTGHLDESGKMVEEGDWDDPMSRKTFHVKNITEIINQNTIKIEMYQTLAGQKEFKAMEIVYTRRIK